MKSLLQEKLIIPLAERMRPVLPAELVGQAHLLQNDAILARLFAGKKISNLIFWGPPGCGKTTLARMLAKDCGYHYVEISAVTSGIAELKDIFAKAEKNIHLGPTVLFADEIHRFNRSQQDVFLPFIEKGTVILIGATTENPSFELNSALLSRCKIVTLKRLEQEDLLQLLNRAEEFCNCKIPLSPEAKQLLCQLADGDGRYLLSLAEELMQASPDKIMEPSALLHYITSKRAAIYDKGGDEHYNLISALHKSLRGSDCDASLYWFWRMISGGEDPFFILRRLVRFASEDIGLADPQALSIAISAKDAYDFLGAPEGYLAITEAVIYLATAPKSNACYLAEKAAKNAAEKYGSLMPPSHILNAPTTLMKEEGYGQGYIYDHDTEEGFSGQNYFPGSMERQTYYNPIERGFEREIKKRLNYWQKIRETKEHE